MATTFVLNAQDVTWGDTLHDVAQYYNLKVSTTGNARVSSVDGYPEGGYPSQVGTIDFRPWNTIPWHEAGGSAGDYPAINVPNPLGLVIAVQGTGGPAPTDGWTRALTPYQPTEAETNAQGRTRVFTRAELAWAAQGYPPPYTIYAAYNNHTTTGADAGYEMTLTLDSYFDGLGGSWDGDRSWKVEEDEDA